MSNPDRWTESTLDQARKEGDQPLDENLMPQLFGDKPIEGGDRHGELHSSYEENRKSFNLLLDIATRLTDAPELAFSEGSELRKHLNQMLPCFRDYFDAMKAPEWVNEEYLAIAAEFWRENSFPILFTLGAASLPYCYMIEKAVPTLYDTRKLDDKRYMNQRIYETGIFVDTVMSEGGLKVSRDFDLDDDEIWQQAIQTHDPDGRWEMKNGQMNRKSSGRNSDEPETEIDVEAVQDHVCKLRDGQPAQRYIWGAGYINAKKVRFLHATMRYMLMNPEAVREPKPKDDQKFACPMEAHRHARERYDVETNGVPINQQDTSYTLMTFSLVLYRAVEKFGREVSDKEKRALLHTWKVIGHTMGVDEKYMTDDPAEAEALFAAVHKYQGQRSPVGVDLTDAVLGWMGSLMPTCIPGMGRHVPTILCEHLMGQEHAKLVLSEDRMNPVEAGDEALLSAWRVIMRMAFWVLALYYSLPDKIISAIPPLNDHKYKLLHGTARAFINSFRGPWARKVFWIPVNATKWKRKKGATPEFQQQLDSWRRGVMLFVVLALVSLVLGGISFAAWLFCLATDWIWTALDRTGEYVLGWLTAFLWVSYGALTSFFIPGWMKKRPVIDNTPGYSSAEPPGHENYSGH